MLPNDFDRLVKQTFGPVLEPRGFTSSKSKRSTFWRQSEDIYHFIIADRRLRGESFDIMVFASSPKIDPDFFSRFPDGVGAPSDTYCRLNAKSGVGPNASRFPCSTASAFLAGANAAVLTALSNVAVPYLDAISSMEELVATIRHPTLRQRGEALLGGGNT